MSPAPVADTRLGAYVPHLLREWGDDTPGYRAREGTLVFADVSGFTRLTEKLSRRGKVGAEEIVTTISEVWQALLSVDGGGDVLKFAGDALILFYQGPDHAPHACQAALAMQRELAKISRIESGAGVVRLRMSVGIHSGTFHLFVVGDEHLDLLVLGEAATTTLDMERDAGPGQVLVSDETAARSEGIRLGGRVGGGVIVRAVPPQPPTEPAGPGPVASSVRFVSPLLRGRLGNVEHEHRRASVAFAQIGGVDTLLRDQGPAVTFERVQGFTQAVMEVLDEYGVLLTSSDVGRDGAVFMMTAGVPDSSGDDEARMLRVALRIVGIDAGLPVRVGVNAGNVFVGDVGPSFRRAYVTMGDTTNLAARMMGQAPWGEVLATSAMLQPVAGRFAWKAVQPFEVKGMKAPIQAALVEGVRGQAQSLVQTGPLVGRDHELETLLAELAAARSGEGRVVEVVGGEGTGKSRLVAEVRRHAGDIAWLTISCDPFEQTSPYHSARSLLRGVLGIPLDADPGEAGTRLSAIVGARAPHLLPWLPLLAVPLDATVENTPEAAEVAEKFRRVRTQQVAAELMEALPPTPAVVVIEDASNMDDASAELVAELVGRIAGHPWLMVITRTVDLAGLHAGRGYQAITLELDPLSESQATELAMRLAETTPVPSHLIPGLVDRAGGNPLFLAELVARAGAGDEEMPHSVEAIIAYRIDALSPEDRRALRYLSVLGERFDGTTLDETLADLGIGSQDDGLWDRLSGFIVRDGNQFMFVNPLVRHVAYEGLTYGWRREIHSRVADLATDRGSDQLPLHLVRAERWEEAWESARRAGDRARRAGANVVAGELYELALTAARQVDPPADEVATVAGHAGDAWARVGIPDRALEAYATAIALAADNEERVLLAGRRAAVHENAGRFPQALGLYARALSEADELADRMSRHRCLGVLHVGYASTRHRQGRHEEAVGHAEEAATHAEEAGDRGTLAYAYHLLDRIHTESGDRDAALRYRDAALPIFAEVGDLAAQGTVLHDLAADAHRGGRLDEASWLYERAIDTRTRAGDVVRAAASVNALGEVELAMGLIDRAEQGFTEALRTWRGARSPEGIAVAARNLGLVSLERGTADEAIRHLEESQRAAADIGAESLLPDTRLALARALLAMGRSVEAWETASLVLDAEGVGGDTAVAARRLRAQALTATGGTTRARLELIQALELAESTHLAETAATLRELLTGPE
jgi:class 3 adenylate cyclase/tetratricopeptide (TPR) repeat protein